MKSNGNYQDDPSSVIDILDCGYRQEIITDSMNACKRRDNIPIEKLTSMNLILSETANWCIQKGSAEQDHQCSVTVISGQKSGT